MHRLLLVLLVATPAFSASIDFDSLPNGTQVTNQFGGVTFSSTSGALNFVTAQSSYNGTKPNFICSGTQANGVNCFEETILDFTIGVTGLTFQAMGINDISANVASVDVFTGGSFHSTIQVAGNAESLNPVLVDLTAFNNVTRIRIYNITDTMGIGWDTFSYTETGGGDIPEPATALLIGGGLGLVYWVRRKRARCDSFKC